MRSTTGLRAQLLIFLLASLSQMVLANPCDSNVVKRLIDSARQEHVSHQQARNWLHHAKGLARRCENPLLLAKTYVLLSDVAADLDSIHFYLEQVNTDGKLKDQKLLADLHLAWGKYHSHFEDYNRSMAHYFIAGKRYLALDDPNLNVAYTSLGRNYYYLGNIDSCLHYFKYALNFAKAQQDSLAYAQATMNIGIVYDINGASDSALVYYNKALDIANFTNNKYILSKTYVNLGTYFQERNENRKAVQYFLDAIPILEKMGDTATLANNLANLATCYVGIRKFALANRYISQVHRLIQQHYIQSLLPFYHKVKTAYFDGLGQSDSTKHYALLGAQAYYSHQRYCEASEMYYQYMRLVAIDHEPIQDSVWLMADTLDVNCQKLTRYLNAFYAGDILFYQGAYDRAEKAFDTTAAFFKSQGYRKTLLIKMLPRNNATTQYNSVASS